MDGFSLLIGGFIGAMVGWAFASGSIKQQDASRKKNSASRAKQEMNMKENEIKSNKESSLSDTVQGFFYYILGFCLIFVLGFILFSSV